LVSLVRVSSHLVLLGLTCSHLVSLVLTGSHLASLVLIYIYVSLHAHAASSINIETCQPRTNPPPERFLRSTAMNAPQSAAVRVHEKLIAVAAGTCPAQNLRQRTGVRTPITILRGGIPPSWTLALSRHLHGLCRETYIYDIYI
jgi:hypothetical protein